MSIASKYNNQAKFNFRVPDDFKYFNLADLYKVGGEKALFPVKAMYINTKSQYGDAPVIATDECLVNVPVHMLETIREMLNDQEAIDAINEDKLGFTVYPYSAKGRKGVFYSIKWVDIER